MKFKQVMILVLSGLSFGLYCPPEPTAPHEVSSSGETNSSASHTATAEKSPKAESQKASQAKVNQPDASAVPVKSSLKSSSSSSSSTSKSVSFGEDSTQTFNIEDSAENSYESNDDYSDIDKHEGVWTDRISSDFGKDNEDITEHNTFMNKYDTKPTQAEVTQYKQRDDIETSAAKEAKKLEPKARAAKNESDVQSLVKEIDTEGVLTDKDIQAAVKAGKDMWLNNFDPAKFQDWVEIISRVKAYLTDGLSGKSKEDIKSVLTARVKSKQPTNSTARVGIEKDLQPAIDKQTARLEKASQEGDDVKSIQIEKNIENLKKIQKNKTSINKVEATTTSEESLFSQADTQSSARSEEGNKLNHLVTTIEECVSKMNDPADQASLTSLFKEMDRISQEPDFATKYTKDQQQAVKYFVENGENIISSVSFALWNAKTIRAQAGRLPKESGSMDLSESNLITKAQANPGRVKSEQQQIAAQASPSLFV